MAFDDRNAELDEARVLVGRVADKRELRCTKRGAAGSNSGRVSHLLWLSPLASLQRLLWLLPFFI